MAGEIQAAAVAANTQMAELIAAHENSSERRFERAKTNLAEFENDPNRLGIPTAQQDITRYRAEVSVAAAEVEAAAGKLNKFARIEMAFDPAADPANRPAGVDTKSGDDLPLRDMQFLVADDRARNVDPAISQERFLDNRNPAQVKTEARRRLQALSSDPDWQAKLSRNDPATWEEFLELSLVARAGPNEPAWSLPIYGSRTA
jgi:hypothetical protein